MSERDALRARVVALVAATREGARDDASLDALLGDLAAWQASAVPAYGRLAASARARARGPGAAPALPTDVFRFARIAAHDPSLDVRVFRTSGTTSESRGEHPFRDLGLYDLTAEAAARHALFPDRPRMRLVMLAPHASELPDSSLSYMLSRFEAWFGEGEAVWVYHHGRLDLPRLVEALHAVCAGGAPVALLGTSFAFVHAEDGLDSLGGGRFSLPPGSRILQTGGFKGRSRTVEPEAMRAMLSARYGVPEAMIVAEYGMTELSSQLYETTLRDAVMGRGPARPRQLWAPGWVRATPVDPETLLPVARGEVGILRIDDAANLDSVSAVQTSDLAERVGEGVLVRGRVPGAVPRGCSLAADAALGGR